MTEIKIYLGLTTNYNVELSKDLVITWCNNNLLEISGGFTLTKGTGNYNGLAEKCIVATILVTGIPNREIINKICNRYCTLFSQDCVLVTYNKVEVDFYK